jgi:hypothetical protein
MGEEFVQRLLAEFEPQAESRDGGVLINHKVNAHF